MHQCSLEGLCDDYYFYTRRPLNCLRVVFVNVPAGSGCSSKADWLF